ncbi:hypothetical protein L484_010900 [Morus notabilis]|uniref:Uncharacterized protein n=1 Tax=Morus notabilis TaxID=981085 RepID=W9R700_9ROSA|nr:hypothetical protein L484_010900 [Morus notabilis]
MMSRRGPPDLWRSHAKKKHDQVAESSPSVEEIFVTVEGNRGGDISRRGGDEEMPKLSRSNAREEISPKSLTISRGSLTLCYYSTGSAR